MSPRAGDGLAETLPFSPRTWTLSRAAFAWRLRRMCIWCGASRLSALHLCMTSCDRCGYTGLDVYVEWADFPEKATGYLNRRALCGPCREIVDAEERQERERR